MYRQFSNRFAEMDHKWSDRLDPSESEERRGEEGGSTREEEEDDRDRLKEGKGRFGGSGKGPKVAAVRCENGRAVSGRRGGKFFG